MDKLLPMLRRDFPDYEAVKAFEAAIPVYRIQLVVEVLERQSLTTFQSYFLQLLALDVNTDKAIAHLLGVDESDLASTAVSLLRLRYMQQGPLNSEKERPLLLTSLGRKILAEEGPPQVPKRKTGTFHLNALTWTSLPQDQKIWQERRMRQDGLPILPMRESDPPTLGDFTEQGVTQALSTSWAFQGRDITDLIQLKKPRLEYIAPVTVVLLQHRNGSEERLAVYRNGLYQQADSVALQRLFENELFRVPQDAALLQEQGIEILLSLPSQVCQVIQELVRSEATLKDLETQVAEHEGRRIAAQGDREREKLVEKHHQIQNAQQVQQAASEELRLRLHEHHIKLLRAGQHRPVLEEALREAKEEVIILSHWMNRRACDEALCRLLGEAVKRGVRIRIGYGNGKEGNSTEAARHQHNIREVKWALRQSIPPSAESLLEMKEIPDSNLKMLLFDNMLAVSGGFDWLSNAGESYRNETGLLFRSQDQVLELTRLALKELAR